eukprot:CAMPEP_0206036918 /NCGR_PEP_ID=MMETSP1466-20131121/3112_1 /ASSEMBLY_ACC=CAM_ASM_001126 /TAXON_ID=44452 /ORGANISM="Pavlova gyrans, Strain CCMP608" /LENGTH=192 /DNA_ID=CAMNT_0053411441 /DNA_START=418 /DNA_END=994 /DNA_ORIENTATION=+
MPRSYLPDADGVSISTSSLYAAGALRSDHLKILPVLQACSAPRCLPEGSTDGRAQRMGTCVSGVCAPCEHALLPVAAEFRGCCPPHLCLGALQTKGGRLFPRPAATGWGQLAAANPTCLHLAQAAAARVTGCPLAERRRSEWSARRQCARHAPLFDTRVFPTGGARICAAHGHRRRSWRWRFQVALVPDVQN